MAEVRLGLRGFEVVRGNSSYYRPAMGPGQIRTLFAPASAFSSLNMPADRTYHIRPVLNGQTLAAGLRGLIAGLSWAEARGLIAGRRVQVNGNLTLDEAR